MVVLLTNGLAVFIHNNWRIGVYISISSEVSLFTTLCTAAIPGEQEKQYSDRERPPNAVSSFLSSYVPIVRRGTSKLLMSPLMIVPDSRSSCCSRLGTSLFTRRR